MVYFRKTGRQSSLNQNLRMGVVKKMSKHRDVETNKQTNMLACARPQNIPTRRRVKETEVLSGRGEEITYG